MEPVIGRVFIGEVVVHDIVTINLPSTSDPHMDAFIEDSLLGELIVDIVLGWKLELGVQMATLLNLVMIVVSVIPSMMVLIVMTVST